MIEDENIPTADPEMLIKQYEPLLYKISGKYRTILDKYPDIDEDDLLQAGRMVIYRFQSGFICNLYYNRKVFIGRRYCQF